LIPAGKTFDSVLIFYEAACVIRSFMSSCVLNLFCYGSVFKMRTLVITTRQFFELLLRTNWRN